MAKLEWHQAVKVMLKNVVKVSTLGNGYGSGVIVPTPRNAPGNCCVLTAYHVIQKAEETGATIEIELAESQEKNTITVFGTHYLYSKRSRSSTCSI